MIVLLSVFVIADSGVYDNVNHNEYNIYNISNATSDYFIGDGSLLTNLNESDLNGSLLNVNSSTYWDSEISQSDLNVNASDYWDLLNSPTDITSLGTIGSATSITSTSFTGPLTGTASIATLWASVSSFNLTQFFDSGNVLIINSTWITNLITGFSYATEADLTTEENLQAANNATQAALINLKIDTSSEGDLNVNSSDYWDSLGSPSDITGLSDSQISSLSWSKLTSYPVSCPDNTYITQLNDSITCTGINSTILNVNYSTTSGTATTWDGETSQADLNVNHSTNSGTATTWDGETSQEDLNVNYSTTSGTATTWASVTNFISKWFFDNNNVLSFNETALNDSIEDFGYSITTGTVTSIDTDDTYLTGGAITSTGTISFNESKMNDTIDARENDTTYTAGNKLYLDGTIFNVNDTDINTSIEAYAYATEADLTTEENLQAANNATQAGLITTNTNNLNTEVSLQAANNATQATLISDLTTLQSADNTTQATQIDGKLSSTGDTATGNYTFDTNTLHIDSTNDRVGIGTTSPDYNLDIAGSVGVDEFIYHNGDPNTYIKFTNDKFAFVTNAITMFESVDGNRNVYNADNADVDFRVETTGGTYTLFVEGSTDYVGIGMSDPKAPFSIEAGGGISSLPDLLIGQVLGTKHGLTTCDNGISDGVALNLQSGSGGSLAYTANGGTSLMFFVDHDGKTYMKGNVGIGTTSPSYPLEVVGSTSGISGYFEANVSAEGFIDRTKGWNGTSNEALKELIKIKSSNGEINHTTMPEFAKASYKEPIRNYINETYEEEICETIMINETKEECNNITVYEDYFYEEKQCEYKKGENTYYNYVCNNIMKIGTRPKEGCYNETRTEWETIKVENKTFYEPKQVIYEVCEEVIIEECKNINYQEPLIECHNETRTRIVEEVTLVEQEGRDLGAMITLLTESVKALQEENDLIRNELCLKDNTYSWCKQDLGVV